MDDKQAKDFLGTGIHFPIRVDKISGHFLMSEGEENIRESIEVILMTSKGERAMRPDFGCDLRRFIYETMDYANLVSMEEEVIHTLNQWEPRITNVDVTVMPAEETNRLDIQISYQVRMTNNPYNLVYPFYLQEGFAE